MAVCIDIEVLRADPNVARGQNQVRIVHAANNIHHAQVMRFELQRIYKDLNLSICAAKRLGDRRALHVSNLVANGELRQIFQLGLIQAFAFQGHQADGLTGCRHTQNDRGKRSRGEASQVCERQIGNVAQCGVGVRSRAKVNFDQTHPCEGA